MTNKGEHFQKHSDFSTSTVNSDITAIPYSEGKITLWRVIQITDLLPGLKRKLD
jgi:hypothetical protein